MEIYILAKQELKILVLLKVRMGILAPKIIINKHAVAD